MKTRRINFKRPDSSTMTGTRWPTWTRSARPARSSTAPARWPTTAAPTSRCRSRRGTSASPRQPARAPPRQMHARPRTTAGAPERQLRQRVAALQLDGVGDDAATAPAAAAKLAAVWPRALGPRIRRPRRSWPRRCCGLVRAGHEDRPEDGDDQEGRVPRGDASGLRQRDREHGLVKPAEAVAQADELMASMATRPALALLRTTTRRYRARRRGRGHRATSARATPRCQSRRACCLAVRSR